MSPIAGIEICNTYFSEGESQKNQKFLQVMLAAKPCSMKCMLDKMQKNDAPTEILERFNKN